MESITKSWAPMVTKLGQLVGKPAAAPAAKAPALGRDRFVSSAAPAARASAPQGPKMTPAEQEAYRRAAVAGMGRLKAHFFSRVRPLEVGVKRTDDPKLAAKQVAFLRHLDAMMLEKAVKAPAGQNPFDASRLEGIKVTDGTGEPSSVNRRLTVPLAGPRSAKELAEAAFHEIF
jgi:hypothetical protein